MPSSPPSFRAPSSPAPQRTPSARTYPPPIAVESPRPPPSLEDSPAAARWAVPHPAPALLAVGSTPASSERNRSETAPPRPSRDRPRPAIATASPHSAPRPDSRSADSHTP